MQDANPYERLCNSLGMTDIIRLQDMLSKALVRRFERRMAVAFSDVVGSTAYFSRFGDEAGRKLQQRHFDLLSGALAKAGGRIVDTAGDGAFLCFDTVDQALGATVALQRGVSLDNANRPRENHLSVRIGIHFGPVLTDGHQVSGDTVNYCARVAGCSGPAEIWLTREALHAASDSAFRARCRSLGPIPLKGIDKPADLLAYEWRDRSLFAVSVRIDGGEPIALPDQDVISFGRLRELEGVSANDIVLQAADVARTQQISRWQFELRRGPDGFMLRAVSDSPTVLNGMLIAKGQQALVRPGAVVTVGNVLTLQFFGASLPLPDATGGETMMADVDATMQLRDAALEAVRMAARSPTGPVVVRHAGSGTQPALDDPFGPLR